MASIEKKEKKILDKKLNFSNDIKVLNKKYKKFSKEYLADLENTLIASDMGMPLVVAILRNISKKVKDTTALEDVRDLVISEIAGLYSDDKHKKNSLNLKKKRTNVILVVGVNGSGKTTSIGKITKKYVDEGNKVLLIAADTFRAGAVEQLNNWCNTVGADISKPTMPNQDPASVVYKGLETAKEGEYDIVIIDTAGRLQNKVNLMKELSKINKIIGNAIPKAPHEILLTIDATTGQNGISQAKQFSEITNVTGIILTKMDGTAKGGICLAINYELNIPIKLVGIGEKQKDLREFNIYDYAYKLLEG